MKYIIITYIILSAFPTCCNEESVETERILLTEKENNLINYSLDQVIKFKHSNGFTFDLLVESDDVRFRRSDMYCDECCGGEYTSYEERYVALNSQYPEFSISLNLENRHFSEEKSIEFKINNYGTRLLYNKNNEFICDSLAICHDKININNNIYFNVLEKELEYLFNFNDSLELDFYPKKILYNKEVGVVQIKMSNNESYFIDN